MMEQHVKFEVDRIRNVEVVRGTDVLCDRQKERKTDRQVKRYMHPESKILGVHKKIHFFVVFSQKLFHNFKNVKLKIIKDILGDTLVCVLQYLLIILNNVLKLFQI